MICFQILLKLDCSSFIMASGPAKAIFTALPKLTGRRLGEDGP